MKQLYFVRHGLSEFNKSNTWAGSSDTPLAPEGHEQAKIAGQKAREQNLKFDIIISSPLERAYDTAKHIADELGYPHENIVIDNLLVERSFGILEGNKDFKATTKYLLGEANIDQYEGVEKLHDLHTRAAEFLEAVKSLPQDTVLVVGHGAHGRALRRVINKEPHDNWGERYDNAQIVRLI